MKNDLSYAPTQVFETFPFPENLSDQQKINLRKIGQHYHSFRSEFMSSFQLGLTKTYNLFHCKELCILNTLDLDLDDKVFMKRFTKTIFNLYKHLRKIKKMPDFNYAVENIIMLRQLHVEIDNEALNSYGWADILLSHDFYEMDYLPENDRIRFTIHPDARKEILKRLLSLNFKRYKDDMALSPTVNKTSLEGKVGLADLFSFKS